MSEHMLNSVCLVGDRFAALGSHENVRTVSGFVSEVRSGVYDELAGPLLVWEGQGITPYEREYVTGALETRGLARKVLMQPNDLPAVPRSQAHKHRDANVLLSSLKRISEGQYRAALRLHPDNELLLDHQTGEHIQGMVVIEAFRQMFMAFCEKFVATALPDRHYYYVWHGMDIRFENFLFPLDADIDCTVISSDITDPARLKMTVDLALHQAGTPAAKARIDFTAHDSARLSSKEHRLAAATVSTVLGGAAAEPVLDSAA
ncbi:A-factor biosynthesis hotdog domain-containing protein [Actinopolyspora xinjiangensis]|uniref:A-factor biosynthesis hotdog domain-containing protein n=1 Tax=Actinopolyspora xinjiangensis TaxID=405564 RepID=A0A1H0PBX9_9ACTN|nr:AfsA-related hotdog domain-containing protein [Actinopolyspora xinjiangensis]SDP02617.1 A-factor biosynthesis hotdog domain-containing protein [Actinopolyspora xinjiangensis]